MPDRIHSWFCIVFVFFVCLVSCKTNEGVVSRGMRKPLREFLRHPLLESSHVGVFVKEAGHQKPILAYQENKRFIPASNVKILTAYLAMQSGLDSTISARVQHKNSRHLIIVPMMDPGFLHPDFPTHALFDSLSKYDTLTFWAGVSLPYGPGWAWEDFDRSFMPSMSVLPMYGNVVTITGDTTGTRVYPRYFEDSVSTVQQVFRRTFDRNLFFTKPLAPQQKMTVPFIPDQATTTALLKDTLGEKEINWQEKNVEMDTRAIKGYPMDTIVKWMMARSDNFYADHLLYHVANIFQWGGKVADWYITHLPPMLNNPVLVDGSGLSRYNLISPADLCRVLEAQFLTVGEPKIRTVYTDGLSGPLHREFSDFGDHLLAKTGTLSGIFCLSGYLKTKAGRILTFSVMINGHRTDAGSCKKLISTLLKAVHDTR